MNKDNQVLAIDRLKSLIEFYGVDSLKHLVGIFKTEAPKRLGLIEESLKLSDMKLLRFHLHQMKSSSANLGSAHLASYLQTLEKSADAGTIDTGSTFETLKSMVNEFITQIDSYLEQESQPNSQSSNQRAV